MGYICVILGGLAGDVLCGICMIVKRSEIFLVEQSRIILSVRVGDILCGVCLYDSGKKC